MTPDLAHIEFQPILLCGDPRKSRFHGPYICTWAKWPTLGVSLLYSLTPHLEAEPQRSVQP